MAEKHPNILVLMADQMQGRVLGPGHVCRTPNLDRLAARGVRFENAYTPNAICSPARASLMTGLLPHSHGVLTVTHCVDEDQSNLRDVPHWAQRLEAAGYRTGYFGKWHVERSEEPRRFGWQVDGNDHSPAFADYRRRVMGDNPAKPILSKSKKKQLPPGYGTGAFYGVTESPPEHRSMGLATGMAMEFLDESLAGGDPWCCFVSAREPHDPFIAGKEAFETYDVQNLPLQDNIRDDLADKPGLYRKTALVFSDMGDQQKREAAACYYASITELDAQFGRLLDRLEKANQLDNTIIIFISDHGELLGSHGLYCKNIGAFEEVYNVPMLLAGPGVAKGKTSRARVGLHDLCPTLLELAGLEPIVNADSRSFAAAVKNPEAESKNFTTGYAEFHGTRYMISQRIAWDGPWKYVHNGFDFDELYNLKDDPQEMHNLAGRAEYQDQVRTMMKQVWRKIRDTKDKTLLDTQYPACRCAPYGPGILDDVEQVAG